MGEWILEPESWDDVAKFAADICQTRALNLSPWEYPPCRAGRDAFGNEGSLTLRDQLIAAGISIYHPDPIAALEATNETAKAMAVGAA